MDRRTFVGLLGMSALGVLALSATGAFGPVLAKDSGGGGGGNGGGSGEGGAKDDKAAGQDGNNSNTDQPGTEAQPEAATECAAGTDCKKK